MGKILLLAVLGLGALYVLHLLAKDYMKIRKPAMKLAKFLFTKRDVDAVSRNSTDEEEVINFHIDWEQILKKDPLKCAQSLICQVVAGAEPKNQDAIIINELMRYAMTTEVPKEIFLAFAYGKRSTNSFEKCYQFYSYCPYSARTMLKALEIYSYLFGD